MNINIREHIKENFKDADIDEIRNSIEASIKENDEITLPGVGVFFELLWNNSDNNNKQYILNTLKDSLNS